MNEQHQPVRGGIRDRSKSVLKLEIVLPNKETFSEDLSVGFSD